MRSLFTATLAGLAPLLLLGCPEKTPPDALVVAEVPVEAAEAEAEAFLTTYNTRFLELGRAWDEAEWEANTRIVPGDESIAEVAAAARRAFSEFAGSVQTIDTARRLLDHADVLTPLQVRQLEYVLFRAAAAPQTVPELVEQLIEAEGLQTRLLYGYDYQLRGEPITTHRIDEVLTTSEDLDERRAVWEASKEIGPTLRENFLGIRDLRNDTVQSLGYDDFYSYRVSEYDMSVEEMDALMVRINQELRPLYRELHTWVRYELAERYGEEVPDLIPAHWLPNRWGQDWASLVEVEGVDVDAALADKDGEWVVRAGEEFYVSLGFPPLPESFWERSDLYPLAEGVGYKKNNHASAWHIGQSDDVRSLMSVVPDTRWYATAHHELGHVYYYLSYTRPEVPPVLRFGTNRAMHEAVGSMMGMAALQLPYLKGRGLVEEGGEVDEVQLLLREALDHVVFMPWGGGVMPAFERALYVEELPADGFNTRWWELKARYQGIAPPEDRGEEFCDPLTKTHISDDPGEYYDYALSYVLLFQMHDHIAREILGQDPRATDYYGSTETGDFLASILEVGATRDWRELTVEKLGQGLTAEPMLAYYQPLYDWLVVENEGRIHTLPEL